MSESSEVIDAQSEIRKRFPAACDDELERFEAAAERMARRMHVMLLTVGGVASERDPAKRLEVSVFAWGISSAVLEVPVKYLPLLEVYAVSEY